MTDPEMITLPLEEARRLFDLAVDSPLVCSGSFETDDVRVLRKLALTIGADPAAATPEEFLRDFPHPFKPFNIELEREEVSTGRLRVSARVAGLHGQYVERRPETDEEVYARLGETPDRCDAGSYHRRCRRPASDPFHGTPHE